MRKNNRMLSKLFLLNLLICSTRGKLNFLFIIVDDLRNSLGCYGDTNAYSPNIDYLTKESIVFSNAYAQQSLCAPSRNSLLTARRPDTLQLYDFYSYWRDVVGNYTTLPQHLKDKGYTTKSIGKIFHPGISSNGSDDSPYSWTEKPFHPYTEKYQNAPVCSDGNAGENRRNLVCPVTVPLMPNQTLPDIETLNEAQKFIHKHRRNSKPFFLAVGFHKPHIPFKFPKKYLKYHPLEKFSIPDHYEWPNNLSSVVYNPWTDLRERDDVKSLHLNFPWQKIPERFAKSIIQSYYASVSYIDDLIGGLINQLSISKIREKTVILLTSDHGWSLGEHSEWAKYSNFDVAVRVPLIISIPSLTNTRYKKVGCTSTDALVELTDIFPTIAELAGYPIPICINQSSNKSTSKLPNPCSEGISLIPLIKTVHKCEAIRWKRAVFSQYPRPSVRPTLHPNSDKPRLQEIQIMGYTVKTKRYRYTAWVEFSHEAKKPNWNATIAEELYDHRFDKEENINVVLHPPMFRVKKVLKKVLMQGWKKALPNK